jgi:hypothetical protein
MSSLPIAQYCARGAELGQVSAGRSAAMSSAFHACASKSPGADALLARLSDAECQEVTVWKRPATITMEAVTLDYAEAARELEVALDANGSHCKADDPACISVGHLDMAWVAEVNGHRVAYVGDIKRSSWTTTDGPDSLQLIAYALAFASLMKCTHFCCGIWAAVEGEWTWGETVDLESSRAVVLLDRVLASIQNNSREYATGAHCHGCYGRMRCPAHLMPLELAETSLRPLTEAGSLDSFKALQLKMARDRAADTIEAVDDALKAYVAQGGVILDQASQKKWAPVQMSGRESLDKAAVEAAGIDLAPYVKRGKPYSQFRWVKA